MLAVEIYYLLAQSRLCIELKVKDDQYKQENIQGETVKSGQQKTLIFMRTTVPKGDYFLLFN